MSEKEENKGNETPPPPPPQPRPDTAPSRKDLNSENNGPKPAN